MAAGLLFILGGLASHLYPLFGEWQHNQYLRRPADESALPAVHASPTPTIEPSLVTTPSEPATPTPIITAQQTPTSTPSPTPTPTSYGPPVWITIPSIRVDARVVAMPPSNGYYWVPGYDVGHHTDSPNPGEPGNSAYTGHVATIDAGRVFARLKEVKVGDAIYVYTESHRTDWVVTAINVYGNKDASFLAPTVEPTLTLYTCHGTFDWAKRDYSNRLAVSASLVTVQPKSSTNN